MDETVTLARWYALSGAQAIRERWVAALQAYVGVYSQEWPSGVSHAEIDAWITDQLHQESAVIPDARVSLIVRYADQDDLVVWADAVADMHAWRRCAPAALARLSGGVAWRAIVIHYGVALTHALCAPPTA
ncbi:MAG: hypothetical protein RMK99_13050 [Anaerolineales bacterium]|nr:hypothetical protein [Anaerolineales bacterium]